MNIGVKSFFIIPPEVDNGESRSLPVGVNDICKDGGLLKMTLKDGEERENPNDPDVVLVKYEARLDDGTLVKISDGVEFTVEDGHFCPALSKAVKTMEKGEIVNLTVKPQYGFGEKGKPAHGDEGSVPPNATLLITLELVSWKIVSKEFGYTKVVVKKGEGYECPDEGDVVKLKLIGKLQDGTIFLKKGYGDVEAELFEFKTDEDKVIEGLDRAVMAMKKGEVALLTIPYGYGFGSLETQQEMAVVPPYSTLYYEVELVSFKKGKESWEMNTEEKIEAARKKLHDGIELFKFGQYDRASKRFKQAVKFIEDDTSFSDDEKKDARVLKLSCAARISECDEELLYYEQIVKQWEEERMNKQGAPRYDHVAPRYEDVVIYEDLSDGDYLYQKSWIPETVKNWGRKMLKLMSIDSKA